MKAPTCTLPSSDQDPQVVDDDDGQSDDGADVSENDVSDATEHADASALPLDLPAEFLIGIQEENAHDPIDVMIVFQKNLELVQEAGKRIHKLEQQRLQAKGTEEAANAAIAVAAEKAKHGQALVDLRRLAKNMFTGFPDFMCNVLDVLAFPSAMRALASACVICCW